jgi:hypothetical protein
MNKQINFGDTLICHETGERFVAALDGISTNYARDRDGNVYSDEGVFRIEARAIRERKGPLIGYVNDAGDLTTWKGLVLARSAGWRPCRLTRISYTHDASSYRSYWFRAPDGGLWYGRGSEGIVIRVRPVKG